MKEKYTYVPVLTIAGSDSGGGAGIQADLKTFSALGCYGMSAITALTAQNTQGVKGIFGLSPDFLALQIETVMEDILPAAIKIGMVPHSGLVTAIAGTIGKYPEIPVVLDPVMIASSGDRLIEGDTVQSIIEYLFPIAALVTPNLDEAALLADRKIDTVEEMHAAGLKIMDLGCKALLLKGGHLRSEQLTSLLFYNCEVISFNSDRIETNNIHGSGCTLSSAIASYLALGMALPVAVSLAQDYVHGAILQGKDVITGKGSGPLNHFYNPLKIQRNELV